MTALIRISVSFVNTHIIGDDGAIQVLCAQLDPLSVNLITHLVTHVDGYIIITTYSTTVIALCMSILFIPITIHNSTILSIGAASYTYIRNAKWQTQLNPLSDRPIQENYET